MASDFGIQIRLELQTAQGESSFKRFEAALEAALARLCRPQDAAILKQLASEEQMRQVGTPVPLHAPGNRWDSIHLA
ncbi:hypothetical protein [Azovibrio restrictus]|uniref:hypothetical protein n=1 Tax=Azovibrio restrictus TaxID=146938 RepID=UPI0026ECCCD4|nr:hypothetical protein [Azovibrio restrictus]